MEKVVAIINKNCTFPQVEKQKLFLMTLFNFLVGNEDMHLKNFSLITEEDGTIHLAPAYDLLSTKLLIRNDKEESALPINEKKNNLQRKDFVSLGLRLKITQRAIDNTFRRFGSKIQPMCEMVRLSFIPAAMQDQFIEMIQTRCARMDIKSPN